MAETIPTSSSDTAEPPGGGQQDHETMREAAMRPVTGPASTDVLAASGGLDVPGREPHPELAAGGRAPAHGGDAPSPSETTVPHEPIPGERDATTLTHREPGAVGGQFGGGDTPSPKAGWMDEHTTRERAREGGGGAAQRSRKQT